MGVYRAVLGPSITGEDRYLDCQGVNSIVGSLRKQSLKEVNKELKRSGLIDQHTPLPKYTAGGSVGVLVGIQDVQLDPILIVVLPFGIGVYRCPFVDAWGSQIAFAGPHLSFTATTANSYSSSMFSRVMRMPAETEKQRTKSWESCRNPRLCHFAPPGWGDSAQGPERHRPHQQQPNRTRTWSGL